LTVTLAVPGPEITSVVIVTCNRCLLRTVVLSVLPLITTTEDETKSEPFTVRRAPCWTWANVNVLGESEAMTGAGRALPHRGLRALQPGKNNKAITRVNRAHGLEGPQLSNRDSGLQREGAAANNAWYVKETPPPAVRLFL
jgi:hypothetical protein